MGDLVDQLAEAVGGDNVLTGTQVHDDYTHDEALTARPVVPLAVVTPSCTAEVARVLRVADENRIPVVARGSGTGLSGASVPRPDGILVSFERMNEILEIDTDNHVAVVQPGVTLEELDRVTAGHGLVYPVFPGESSASLGGQCGHQRRRDAGHQVRGDPTPGPRPRGRPGHRGGDPDGGEVREVVDGLRPDTADRRLRGDARPRHRGHGEAPSPRRRTRRRSWSPSPRSTR